MTQLALGLSTYVNGVAKVHGETSRQCFRKFPSKQSPTVFTPQRGLLPHFSSCFDGYIASWREDNYSLRGALGLPAEDVWSAHLIAKHELFEVCERKPGLILTLKLSRSGSRAAPPDTSAPTSFLPTLTGFDRLPRTQARSRLFMRGKPIPTTGRKGHHSPHLSGEKGVAQNGSNRFPGQLRSGTWRKNHFRRGLVAQYAAISPGGFRHERHEGGTEWRAEFEHPGWLVGGRAYRRRDRLVDRGIPACGGGRCRNGQRGGGRFALFQDGSVILPMYYNERSRFPGSDAARHRHQWIILQYPTHGAAVHYGCVPPLTRR